MARHIRTNGKARRICSHDEKVAARNELVALAHKRGGVHKLYERDARMVSKSMGDFPSPATCWRMVQGAQGIEEHGTDQFMRAPWMPWFNADGTPRYLTEAHQDATTVAPVQQTEVRLYDGTSPLIGSSSGPVTIIIVPSANEAIALMRQVAAQSQGQPHRPA